MELLEATDSLVETKHTNVSTNLNDKNNLKPYNESAEYTEALLEKIRLEREIEEENRCTRVFCIRVSLFVLIGIAIIYFVVEAIYA